MIKLTNKQAIMAFMFSFLILLCGTSYRYYNSKLVLENSKITVVEFLKADRTRGSLYCNFKVIHPFEKIIRRPCSGKYKKKGDRYIFLYLKDDPENFIITYCKTDYELGANLDTVLTVEELIEGDYIPSVWD